MPERSSKVVCSSSSDVASLDILSVGSRQIAQVAVTAYNSMQGDVVSRNSTHIDGVEMAHGASFDFDSTQTESIVGRLGWMGATEIMDGSLGFAWAMSPVRDDRY